MGEGLRKGKSKVRRKRRRREREGQWHSCYSCWLSCQVWAVSQLVALLHPHLHWRLRAYELLTLMNSGGLTLPWVVKLLEVLRVLAVACPAILTHLLAFSSLHLLLARREDTSSFQSRKVASEWDATTRTEPHPLVLGGRHLGCRRAGQNEWTLQREYGR